MCANKRGTITQPPLPPPPVLILFLACNSEKDACFLCWDMNELYDKKLHDEFRNKFCRKSCGPLMRNWIGDFMCFLAEEHKGSNISLNSCGNLYAGAVRGFMDCLMGFHRDFSGAIYAVAVQLWSVNFGILNESCMETHVWRELMCCNSRPGTTLPQWGATTWHPMPASSTTCMAEKWQDGKATRRSRELDIFWAPATVNPPPPHTQKKKT